jgi:hypothetical protein
MKKLPFHKHLVNMIGCVTTAERPLLVVELCALGDLVKLLHRTERSLRLNATLDEVQASFSYCIF